MEARASRGGNAIIGCARGFFFLFWEVIAGAIMQIRLIDSSILINVAEDLGNPRCVRKFIHRL